MSRSVHNKVAAEREKGGLIILEAQYGLASAFSDRGIRRHRPRPPSSDRSQVGEEGEGEGRGEEEEVVIDVTMPVQALVVDSKLSIPGGRGKVCRYHTAGRHGNKLTVRIQYWVSGSVQASVPHRNSCRMYE